MYVKEYAVFQTETARGAPGGRRVVRDEDDGVAALVQAVEQREYIGGGDRVEARSRLVREQHAGARDNGARDGDALLLTAGKRVRQVSDWQTQAISTDV